jgi:hypothetical protein
MNKKITRYIIGNKGKTKFLGYDKLTNHLVVLDNLESDDLEIMTQQNVDNILETNRYTNFYIVNDMKHKYKLVFELE